MFLESFFISFFSYCSSASIKGWCPILVTILPKRGVITLVNRKLQKSPGSLCSQRSWGTTEELLLRIGKHMLIGTVAASISLLWEGAKAFWWWDGNRRCKDKRVGALIFDNTAYQQTCSFLFFLKYGFSVESGWKKYSGCCRWYSNIYLCISFNCLHAKLIETNWNTGVGRWVYFLLGPGLLPGSNPVSLLPNC